MPTKMSTSTKHHHSFSALYYNTSIAILFHLLIVQFKPVSSLLCYSCVSTQPGCTMEKVDWLIHSAVSCPEPHDKCVKIIEQRGAETTVIRDCLSQVLPYRDDIPADHFEGCRPATTMPKKAVYVDNTIDQLELNMDHPTTANNVTYCFCEFDQWCNGVDSLGHIGWLTCLLLVLSCILNQTV